MDSSETSARGLPRLRVWLLREDRGLFLGLLLLHLVAVWSFPFFPSQDGPGHVETANILRRYHAPESSLFRSFYSLSSGAAPNRLGHWIMAGLLFVFPPLITEKLLVSFYVALFPLAVRYALRSIDPRAGYLAVLAFPFVFSWLLHMGFYNFCLSAALFFFAAGYWLRHEHGLSPRDVAVLAALLTLLYFAHVVGLAMVLILMAVLCLWFPLASVTHSSLWRLAATALGALPAVILMAGFLGRSRGQLQVPARPAVPLCAWFRDLRSLVSFHDGEMLLAKAVFWGFALTALGILAARARRQSLRKWDGLLAVAGAYTCAFFTLPPGLLGDAHLSEQLSVFPFFALILWFGSVPSPARLSRWAIQGAATCIALAWLALHMGRSAELTENFREYRSIGGWIQPESTLLPLRYRGVAEALRVDVFLRTAGYVAAEKNLVQLVSRGGDDPEFPIVFRPGLNPYPELGNSEARLPCVDIPSYSARTGVPVDYVLLWRLDRVAQREACVGSVLTQLEAAYDHVFTSAPRGLARLYRRKGWTPRTTESAVR